MIDHDATPLAPLRIAAGWLLSHNQLREVDPEHLEPSDPRWDLLMEDLMQARYGRDDLLVDVGWYPDQDPGGHFGVVVLFDQDWERPIVKFRTRSLIELVEKLESWFARPPAVPTARLVERLAGGPSERRCLAAEQLARQHAIEAIDALTAALNEETVPPVHERMKAALYMLFDERARREAAQ
jgi:hypothetical protein